MRRTCCCMILHHCAATGRHRAALALSKRESVRLATSQASIAWRYSPALTQSPKISRVHGWRKLVMIMLSGSCRSRGRRTRKAALRLYCLFGSSMLNEDLKLCRRDCIKTLVSADSCSDTPCSKTSPSTRLRHASALRALSPCCFSPNSLNGVLDILEGPVASDAVSSFVRTPPGPSLAGRGLDKQLYDCQARSAIKNDFFGRLSRETRPGRHWDTSQ